MHRSGCVISHLFVACVVLITDPALATTGDQATNSEAEAIRVELGNARQLLERAGEKSSMAASLVAKLVGTLKKHRVQAMLPVIAGTGCDKLDSDERAEGASSFSHASASKPPVTMGGDSLSGSGGTTNPGTGYPPTTAEENKHNGTAQQPMSHVTPMLGLSSTDGRCDDSWGYSDGLGSPYDPHSLDGLEWTELLVPTFTGSDGWGPLFTDLDAAFAASL
jgi:hypothetical protein